MNDQPETPADLYDRLRPVVAAIDPTETDDDGRHSALRYRPTVAELADARAALGRVGQLADLRRQLDQAHADLAEATEARALLAAGLEARGTAVPHLASPRVLAEIALGCLAASGQAAAALRADLDKARAAALQADHTAERIAAMSANATRETLDAYRVSPQARAARLATTLREILAAVEWTPEGWAALCVDRAAFDRWRAALADTGTHDQQPTDDPAPTGRQCDALCRDIETDLDRMTPVVAAARSWRHAAGLDDGAAELIQAVDAYEATPGIAPVTGRPSADDVHLTGPADTPLGRATVALAVWLNGCCLDLDAEELAKVALDAAFPDDGYHQPDYTDPSWSAPADHRAEATALLQVATEPPETRDWTADPTHVLLAAIAHAILATAPAPAPAPQPADARESVATVRRHVANGDEDWTGADLIRRTVGPWEVVPDGPETAPSATHSPEPGSADATGPTNPAQGN